MSIQKITEEEIARHGVSSLPNRPSAPSLYGGEAMTADELRAAFDSLPRLVAERLNAFIESAGLYGEEAKESLASLIATHLSEGHSLENLFADVQNGTFANYLSVDEGAQSLTEALSALRSTLSLPDGFSDLRSYVDAPRGRVEEGSPLPVSGNAVFLHTKEVEERISTRILPTDGEVKAGDSLPVSGDRVFQSLTKATSPLDTRLSVIEGAMEGLSFHFDTVTAEEGKVSVPPNALRYARIESIGGYTRKSKNLLPLLPNTDFGYVYPPYGGSQDIGANISTDENGYLCIDSGGERPDGLFEIIFNAPVNAERKNITFTARYISGEAWDDFADDGGDGACLAFEDTRFYLPTADNPIVSVTTTDGTATLDGTYVYNAYLGFVGAFKDYKFSLMAEEGTTATDFEPYFEGLKSAKVTAVKSYGKNLVPSTVYDFNNWVSGTETFAAYDLPQIEYDGDYTLNCKKNPDTAWGGTILSVTISKNGGASWTFPDGWANGYYLTSDMAATPKTFSLKKGDRIRLKLYPKNQSALDKILDIQLERGSKATDYSPYVGLIDTYTVPEAVQALEGYGNGLSSVYNNTVDFPTKKYTEKCREIVLTGKETYSFYMSGENNVVSISGVLTEKHTKAKGLCTDGTVKTSFNATLSDANDGDMFIGLGDNKIYWVEAKSFFGVTSDASFKAYIAERYASGNPVRILYDVVTDTETDVPDLLLATAYIEVMPGGHIEALSEDGIAAFLTVTYQIKNEN